MLKRHYFLQLEVDSFAKNVISGDIDIILVTADKNVAKSREVYGKQYVLLELPSTRLREVRANARQMAALLFELTIETPILEIKTDNALHYLFLLAETFR